jgi:hypothetical protein
MINGNKFVKVAQFGSHKREVTKLKSITSV